MLRMALLGLVVLLSACQSSGTIAPATDTFGTDPGIFWDRSPDTIVFRAEIAGGNRENEFLARNDIAPCTVYGDNRIVWTNDLGPYEQQVLYDQVEDGAIRLFVELLTVVDQLYNYPGQANVQLPSSTVPVYEQITINVAGRSFTSDAFAGWPSGFFERVLERCRTISQAPVLFEPTAGWMSAEQGEYSFETPMYPWDSAAAGVSLAELASSGERRWVTDRVARSVWNLIRNSPPGVLLEENGQAYRVALEAPRVNRYAPPAQGQ